MSKIIFIKINDFFFHEIIKPVSKRLYKVHLEGEIEQAIQLAKEGKKVVLLISNNDVILYSRLCPPHPSVLVLSGRQEGVTNKKWTDLQQLILNQFNQRRHEYNFELTFMFDIRHMSFECNGIEYALINNKNHDPMILGLSNGECNYISTGLAAIFHSSKVDRIARDKSAVWLTSKGNNGIEIKIKFTVSPLKLTPLKPLTVDNLHLETVHYPIPVTEEPSVR
ncbi:MAG: hypothetical protein AAB657_04055 [Patescibacteria group bacterium]